MSGILKKRLKNIEEVIKIELWSGWIRRKIEEKGFKGF